ncbi:RNA polymerase sigma factor [Patescibacteria group bacterium]
MEINELQIIQECQKGNLDRFAEIYDVYIKKIYSFIYYRIGHKQTAEDIVSTVFMKSMEKINSFDSNQGKFSSWLYRIARNSVIDHYRTKKDAINIDDIWDLGESDNFNDKFDANLKLKEVRKYMQKFSKEQKEIIIMRVWDGLSYKEIAEITNKSEASLKMTVSRILNKVRKEPSLTGLLLFIKLIVV